MNRLWRTAWGPGLLFGAVLVLSAAATFRALPAMNVPALLEQKGATPMLPVTPRAPVLLIVVDGLGESAARTLPSLQRIAREGGSARVKGEFPTFSAPAYVTFLTGVGPRLSGRRNNAALFAVRVDSLARQLSAQGRAVRVLSDEVDWWATLVPELSELEVLRTDELVRRAEAWMDRSDLLVVHLCGVDAAGHAHGAGSEAYRKTAAEADATVARLVERWGNRGAVAVASDHGHVARGGHGGDEEAVLYTWLVARGPQVAPARDVTLSMTDVAPTIAAYLGAPAPNQAEGRTALSLVEAPADALRTLEARDGERLASLRHPTGAVLERVGTARRAAQKLRGAIALVALVGAIVAMRRALREFGRGALAGVLAVAIVAAVQLGVFGRVSFSAAPLTGYIAARSAALTLLALAVLLPLFLRRSRLSDAMRPGAVLFGCVWACGLPAAAIFTIEGAFAQRPWLSDPAVAALPLYVWPIAGAAAAAALVALGASALFRSRSSVGG